MRTLFHRLGQKLCEPSLFAGIFVLLASLLMLLPLPGMDVLIGVAVALVLFARGVPAALSLLAWLAIPVLAQVVLREMDMTFMMSVSALVIGMLSFVVALLYRQFRQALSVAWLLTLLGVILVLYLHWRMPQLVPLLMHYISTQLQTLTQSGLPATQLALLHERLVALSPWLLGLLWSVFSMSLWLYVCIGKVWQQRLLNTPSNLWSTLRLQRASVALMLLVLIGLWLHMPVMQACLLIVCAPAFMVGMVIWHQVARYHWVLFAGLGFMYILLFWMPSWLAVFWVATAVFDAWFDARAMLQRCCQRRYIQSVNCEGKS